MTKYIEKVIGGIAKSMMNKNNTLEYNDLFQEGYLAYLMSEQTYRPELGPRERWNRYNIIKAMSDYISREKGNRCVEMLYEGQQGGANLEDLIILEDLLRHEMRKLEDI